MLFTANRTNKRHACVYLFCCVNKIVGRFLGRGGSYAWSSHLERSEPVSLRGTRIGLGPGSAPARLAWLACPGAAQVQAGAPYNLHQVCIGLRLATTRTFPRNAPAKHTYTHTRCSYTHFENAKTRTRVFMHIRISCENKNGASRPPFFLFIAPSPNFV